MSLSRWYVWWSRWDSNPLPLECKSHKLASRSNKGLTTQKLFSSFLQSREANNVTFQTLEYYRYTVGRFLEGKDLNTLNSDYIEKYLLQYSNAGGRHAQFRAIKVFYTWLEQTYHFPSPMKYLRPPKLGKLILPTLKREQVNILLEQANNTRDKTIIALFTESGLRLTELANIRLMDIDWQKHTVQVIGKGRKERLAPFGKLTETYLNEHLKAMNLESNDNIWGLNKWGIASMLRWLEAKTGITCNPHTFRRTFATLLREAGTDSLIIKDLGGWESVRMVEKYTRAFRFEDAIKHYKSPLT
jgi:integrase/recombinase XerD